LVLCGVESPEVSSSLASGDLPVPAYHGGMLRRGPQSVSKGCGGRWPAALYGSVAQLEVDGGSAPAAEPYAVEQKRTRD